MAVQTLLKNKFAEIIFDTEKSLVDFQCFETITDMTEEDYKEMFLTYVKTLTELYKNKTVGEKSLLYLSDIRKMDFVVVPELQEWTDKEVVSKILPFSKKSAILLPTDLFASVSAQQTVSEENATQVPTQYFDNEAKALEWLFAS